MTSNEKTKKAASALRSVKQLSTKKRPTRRTGGNDMGYAVKKVQGGNWSKHLVQSASSQPDYLIQALIEVLKDDARTQRTVRLVRTRPKPKQRVVAAE
jgi:hypothetical protein